MLRVAGVDGPRLCDYQRREARPTHEPILYYRVIALCESIYFSAIVIVINVKTVIVLFISCYLVPVAESRKFEDSFFAEYFYAVLFVLNLILAIRLRHFYSHSHFLTNRSCVPLEKLWFSIFSLTIWSAKPDYGTALPNRRWRHNS